MDALFIVAKEVVLLLLIRYLLLHRCLWDGVVFGPFL